MSSIVCLQDLEDYAGKHLAKNAYDYYRSGANDEQTLHDNRAAFQRLRIRPRILRDVSVRDLSTTVLGQPLPFPIAIAPTAMQRMAHPEGELATARAATAAGTGMILSSWATSSIEEVAEASGSGIRWFQLYIYRDRETTRNLVKRAERAGYKALFVTVDTPILGKRLSDVRNKFSLPEPYRLANFAPRTDQSRGVQGTSSSGLAEYVASQIDPSLSWKHIEWLKSITTLPIVLKGVLTAEDAREAVAHNVAGIVVSNHGARQLDGVPATIDALPEVVEAVRGTGVEVYLDGGVRTGTDVLKALALGARAVFIGRPALWGLAFDGEAGVKLMIELLKGEFDLAMSLAGCPCISNLDKNMIRRQPPHYSKL
ncbi:2-Hydroxyacid oxidase 1-like [Diadema setosum]|uniref:2-Hydroxyacid oxidase 1-like n=1 Tax=Diadema setosum TaxID=31175 RepID=UPI003B3A0164